MKRGLTYEPRGLSAAARCETLGRGFFHSSIPFFLALSRYFARYASLISSLITSTCSPHPITMQRSLRFIINIISLSLVMRSHPIPPLPKSSLVCSQVLFPTLRLLRKAQCENCHSLFTFSTRSLFNSPPAFLPFSPVFSRSLFPSPFSEAVRVGVFA